MALSGSLRDFDISNIFQIVSQENKTGKLFVATNDENGWIIFKNGTIISAGTSSKNLHSILFSYLLTIKKYPQNEVNELKAIYHNRLRDLTIELINNGYISQNELLNLLESAIVDIACNIFGWKNGNYKFETLSNVDMFQIANFTVSVNAVAMEAARQMDEIARMDRIIQDDTIFILSIMHKGDHPQFSTVTIDNFSDYLKTKIDGVSSVKLLCNESFCSKFQILTTLNELLQLKQIVPLSDKISYSINVALSKTHDQSDTNVSKVMFSSVATATIILLLYFSGFIILKGYFYADKIQLMQEYSTELLRAKAATKVSIAKQFYHGNLGTKPSNIKDILNSKILHQRDLRFLKVGKNGSKKNNTAIH